MFTEEQTKQLNEKLSTKNVKQRSQGGGKVSYVESWLVISEANRIFGFGNWSRETISMDLVNQEKRKVGKEKKDGYSVTYIAKIRITVGNIIKEGTGAGHGIGADLGQQHESATKEAESDAMKRALMMFGNQFGLALYDKNRASVANPDDMTAEQYLEQQIKELENCKDINVLSSLYIQSFKILSNEKALQEKLTTAKDAVKKQMLEVPEEFTNTITNAKRAIDSYNTEPEITSLMKNDSTLKDLQKANNNAFLHVRNYAIKRLSYIKENPNP